MKRIVQPELLDALPPNDTRAVRSRRDLRRVNVWMGNVEIMARLLTDTVSGNVPEKILDLGAGDGEFMRRVARRLARTWSGVNVILLDRQDIVSGRTRGAFEQLGWRVEVVTADAFEWAKRPATKPVGMIVVNLFLHHFHEAQLAALFADLAKTAQAFVAVEPRRSALSLVFSRMLWLIGCNAVTRHDAVVSVKAGFAGQELSALWPNAGAWRLEERPAGLFSHLFIAQRKN